MKLSKQARRQAKELFRAAFVSGVMDEAKVREIVQKMIQARPRGYIAILEHFQRLVKLEQDRRAARVESAVPLTPEQQAGVSSSLTRIYGRGLNISFEENPALIGGLRVRVGSDVYDGSVKARLEQLETSF